MAETQESITSLDNAIKTCDEDIDSHKKSITALVVAFIMSISILAISIIWSMLLEDREYQELLSSYNSLSAENDSLRKYVPSDIKIGLADSSSFVVISSDGSKSDFSSYVFYLVVVIAITVSTGLYRLHLKEISKAERNRIAFYRIGIAGSNYIEGYATEVRQALTENPFADYKESPIFQKTTKIESPLQGNPAAEVVTTLINKLLEISEDKKK